MKVIRATFTIITASAIAAFAQQDVYQQCGGTGWTGGTTCITGSACTFQNTWYSQCLPSGSPASAPASKSTTATSASTSPTGTQISFSVPTTIPSTAVTVDPALLSVSIEFFAFPGYTQLAGTEKCLGNIQALRGIAPAVRIGGTTQDRATYNPSLATAVQYTVDSPADAPASLTYGPSFFTLANALPGDVTIGLNRQLNNISNTGLAAIQAKKSVAKLLALELGNEPEFYAAGSPIIPAGSSWTPTVDGASQKQWFTSLQSSVGDIFQAAVYLQYPTWSTTGLIPLLGNAISYVRTFSGHSYPQSACGGASTNLQTLMSHSSIVSYTKQYAAEAESAHAQNKRYFLGETNSATCGGGGISNNFGAGLWVMDYVLQGALNGVERLYFHQGTIGNCAYCFWGNETFAPYYGAIFVSEFLGSEGGSDGSGTRLAALDSGTGSVGVYGIYSTQTGKPLRLLVYNSAIFSGSGTRSSTAVDLTGLTVTSAAQVKRLSAPNATSLAGNGVTIGGGGTFDAQCNAIGTQSLETANVSGGNIVVNVKASEAVIVYLS